MIARLLKLPLKEDLLLFGPRNTGKSTLLEQTFPREQSIFFDLLNPLLEERFAKNPMELDAIVKGLSDTIDYVVIDEIQKVPKLLDVVHALIEQTNKNFIMTGSSARKLKLGGSNLLAGRAFVYYLHPFSVLELEAPYNLDSLLSWGLLPKAHLLQNPQSKIKFLQTYAHTYLKEEIWAEHFIRDLDPFRYFLEVAAQMNGKLINFSKIARDVGVDDKTIRKYYSILEDTLVGSFVYGFQNSLRKTLRTHPKFYFFDLGVTRALSRTLSIPLQKGTSAYGDAFEHFIITEIIKLSSYFYNDYRFNYFMTKNGVEIDLVVDRPGKPTLLIEIKSAEQISGESLRSFLKISEEWPHSEAICLCNDPYQKVIGHIQVLPWNIGLEKYFLPCGEQ